MSEGMISGKTSRIGIFQKFNVVNFPWKLSDLLSERKMINLNKGIKFPLCNVG